ncbi:MAG: helix-turn-helix transcriptional regulator [Clostridia bacterium]|nr:helix-turn-helix transcriptional regulator [Clostridia bacterium]
MNDRQTLDAARPAVLRFHRAVENTMRRRKIAANPAGGGRKYDGLIFITAGQTLYRFADRKITVKQGDVLYLARGDTYAMEVESESYSFIFADFDFAGQARPQSDRFSPRNTREVERLFRRLLYMWQSKSSAYYEGCMSLLYAVYAEVLQGGTERYLPSARRRTVEKAVAFMAQHLAKEDLDVEQIAAAAGVSTTGLRRMFSAVYGMPPVRYLLFLRLERAKEQLLYSDISLTSIAAMCGFCSLYYFSRVFKKEIGMPPGAFRTRGRGGAL